MNISDITIGQLQELRRYGPQSECCSHPYEIGKNYFIRTVTHHYTGKLVEVYDKELVITDASWIADDGRFASAVAEGKFNEVEPYPDGAQIVIGRGSIIDACVVGFKIPRSQK